MISKLVINELKLYLIIVIDYLDEDFRRDQDEKTRIHWRMHR
jgi:hypothetical protein